MIAVHLPAGYFDSALSNKLDYLPGRSAFDSYPGQQLLIHWFQSQKCYFLHSSNFGTLDCKKKPNNNNNNKNSQTVGDEFMRLTKPKTSVL